ncbi:MAG: serine hydrolase [Scrofimicrobium sp.]
MALAEEADDSGDDGASQASGFEEVFRQVGPIAQMKKKLTQKSNLGPTGEFGGRIIGGLPAGLHISVSFDELISEADTVLANAPENVLNTQDAAALKEALEAARSLDGTTSVGASGSSETRQNLSETLYEFENRVTSYNRLLEELAVMGRGEEGATAWVEDEDSPGGGFTALLGEGQVGIQVLDLSTGLPVVSLNQSRPFTMASTYKLYVASSMIDAVDSGAASWSDDLIGMTVDECFNEMIVYSDNDCPEAWLEQTGWENIGSTLGKLGAQETTFEPNGLISTPADLARALEVLASPDSMTEDSHQRLFYAMENQVFRDGIPATLDPIGTVADKVGFLEPEELHDAAIVSTPKGEYAIVIMTVYLSWETIAQMTQMIYDYL